jgi:hypothetical protein
MMMRKLFYLMFFVPILAWGQYNPDGLTIGTDSINLKYISGPITATDYEVARTIYIPANIVNDQIAVCEVTSTGTNASKDVTILVEDMAGNTISGQRFVVRIWASSTEFGGPGKLSRVTFENLSGTAYAIYPTYTQSWAPETRVEEVMTESDGEVHFQLTSSGDETPDTQWLMVEVQGIVYSFSFTMWSVLGGGTK